MEANQAQLDAARDSEQTAASVEQKSVRRSQRIAVQRNLSQISESSEASGSSLDDVQKPVTASRKRPRRSTSRRRGAKKNVAKGKKRRSKSRRRSGCRKMYIRDMEAFIDTVAESLKRGFIDNRVESESSDSESEAQEVELTRTRKTKSRKTKTKKPKRKVRKH